MSYYVNIEKDPCYARVIDLKETQNFTGLSPQLIEIAGVTGSFYLQSYALSVPQNDIVKAEVSYVGYELTTGDIKNRESTFDYISSGFSGFAHAWSTKVISDAGELDVPIYDFKYSFTTVLNPIYVLGNKFPTRVQYLTSEEDIVMMKDESRDMVWSGEAGCNIFDSCDGSNPRVKLLKLASLCDEEITDGMEFDVKGSQMGSRGVKVDTNEFVSVTFNVKKYN